MAGKIKLFTELECCPICLDVMEQFEKLYPNIDIEVICKIKK
ncbi:MULTISPECIES: deaminase domain-containing protein [unclassified Bacillus (in: firmicutes)]